MGVNKKLNQEDISQFVTEDLVGKINEERNALKKMEFNHAVTPLDNPAGITAKRKDLARMITELNKRSSIPATK